MTALFRLALFALVGMAGFGTSHAMAALVPALPADLRGFASACLTIAAAALVLDRVPA